MTLRVVYSLVILLVTGLMVVAAQKIDPRLLGLPENQKKEVVVVMKEQADLSEAENVRGKHKKPRLSINYWWKQHQYLKKKFNVGWHHNRCPSEVIILSICFHFEQTRQQLRSWLKEMMWQW